MTTFTDFSPSVAGPFQFEPELDGQTYSVIVTWNVYSQRWYVNIYDLSGNLIVSIPNIGSPLNHDINLVAGYFTTSTLIFRQANQQFEVNP